MKSTNLTYAIKVTFIILAIIILQVATIYLLYANSNSVLREDYRVGIESSITADADIFGNRLSENYNDFTRFNDASYIADKYIYCGTFSEGKLKINATEYTLSITARQNIETQKICFHTLNEIVGNGEEQVCIIYANKIDANTIQVLIQLQDSFLRDFNNITFTNVAMVNGTSKIIACTDTDIEQQRLSDFIQGDYLETLKSETTTSVDVTINGTRYILTIAPIKVSIGNKALNLGLTAVGYKPLTDIIELIGDVSDKNLVLMGTSTFILMVLLLALGSAMRKQYDYLRAYKITSRGKFVVFVDNMGKIKECNKEFADNFARCNIFDNVIYFNENRAIKDGDNIIVYVFNRENEKRLLSFFVAKVPYGFKLVGVDSTEVLENSNSNIFARTNLTIKELQGQYNKDILTAQKLLLGVIDITNLKNLDLMFGRAFSESVFDMVGKRVRKRFGRVYEMPGGRIGVLVSDPKELEYTLKDMTLIMDSFSQAVLIDENLVNINCRAGFALCDSIMEDHSFAYVQNCANAALKRAIKEERINYYVYHESQKKLYVKLMDKSWDIKSMLQSNSFEMGFQPQYNLSNDKPYGFEALFRVKKSLSMEVDIFELITYAERTGNMILLGEFIFNEGMKFAKSIEDTGVHVSLNVSPVQLMQAGFVDSFLSIYKKYKLKPNSISIEITESFLMANFDEVLKKLQILQENGIDIHLDDFGVAYSSLLYLKKLPISAIKIDKEFIADIATNDYSRAITNTIIDITKYLGQICISEGIETEQQKAILKSMGCDVIQGFLMGKAMPADEARRLLNV